MGIWRKLVPVSLAGALALGSAALSGCGPYDAYYAGVGISGVDVYGSGVTLYGGEYRLPYYYPSPYYDWFAYGPTYRGPYYHGYPNLPYYLDYRPIYPG